MEQNELPAQIALIENEMQRILRHKSSVEEELVQLSKLNEQFSSVSSFSDKKILSQIDRGIYTRSVVQGEKLFVQVGAGVVVERSISEVKEILQSNISQLKEAFYRLNGEEEFYEQQMQGLFVKATSKD